jgi:L-lysine epsilon oxidase C-terminal domain/L-Lysine epsilon oxidase N-terminal
VCLRRRTDWEKHAMAFPSDLSDVVVFKVHPAIGVARLSANDDYFIFGSDPGSYKSNNLMKRQAVQFRVFAYGDNHVGLGELSADVMDALNITAVWSAKVANRKIANQLQEPLAGAPSAVSAEASSDAKGGRLTGSLPGFDEGAAIPMGQITADGVFIPPKTGVFRKTAGEDVPGFPGSATVVDNTCDGMVTVNLVKDGKALDVLPACIVVCAHDFSPDVDPDVSLLGALKDALQISPNAAPGNLHNQAARNLDEAALTPGTGLFDPGIEMSLNTGTTEVHDIKGVFYQNSQDPRVDPREMRVRYKSAPTDQGAVPGQLTSGLCSPWQSDYTACVGFWTDHLPPDVFRDVSSSDTVRLFRKQRADTSPLAATLRSGNDFLQVDQVGVARLRSGKLVETERTGDIGDGTA